MKPRHVPIRTCAGCRQERPKREMVRVVRTPEGSVVVDQTGKGAGRGAYLCPSFDCWDRALRGSLAHTLKAEISASDRAQLERAAATYPREATRARTAAL
jgi:predicted RNA-binding protein YlxR (DUF448 family)